MEGPWLNPDPGYRGAHDPTRMQKPSLRLLDAWWKITGPLLKLITIARRRTDICRRARSHPRRPYSATSSSSWANSKHACLGADSRRRDGGGRDRLDASPSATPRRPTWRRSSRTSSCTRWRSRGLHPSIIPDGLHVPPHVFRVFALLCSAIAGHRACC